MAGALLGSAKAFLSGQPLAFVASAYGVNSMLFTGSYLGETPVLIRSTTGKLVEGRQNADSHPRMLRQTRACRDPSSVAGVVRKKQPIGVCDLYAHRQRCLGSGHRGRFHRRRVCVSNVCTVAATRTHAGHAMRQSAAPATTATPPPCAFPLPCLATLQPAGGKPSQAPSCGRASAAARSGRSIRWQTGGRRKPRRSPAAGGCGRA